MTGSCVDCLDCECRRDVRWREKHGVNASNCGRFRGRKVKTDEELRKETEELFRKLHEHSDVKYDEEKVKTDEK